MLIGTIRPVETRTLNVEGHSLAEVRDTLAKQAPEGFELVSCPVRMTKGSTLLTSVGTYRRRDGRRDIEADDRTALWAKVPDGYELLALRTL
jgi:hypothetical protein